MNAIFWDSATGFETFEQAGTPAHGLPAFAYTSTAFWQRENQTLFPNSWVFVGFAHEIANPGDVQPITVAGSPILLLRNQDGDIRAFHNVCRHRCLQLVDKPTNVGRIIRCPYHTWSYDLNGSLRATPHFGGVKMHDAEGFDRTENGLVPVRVAHWYDWIFVNLNANAPAFSVFIEPLVRNLKGLDLDRIELVGMIDLGVVASNWKFLMENFIEPYHVQFVHASTTDQPLANHYPLMDDGCLGSAVDLPDEHKKKDERVNTLAVSSRYLALFPNFVFGRYFPDQIGVHQNIPLGPGQTRQRRAIYQTDGHRLNTAEAEALKILWTNVHREDHAMCERLQAGRASVVADSGGFLSPVWENSVRRFQELVVDAVA